MGRELIFYLEAIVLVKKVLMMDLFFKNTQLYTSQDMNWWTGVDYCDVLSAV